jgi:hypothetical protein
MSEITKVAVQPIADTLPFDIVENEGFLEVYGKPKKNASRKERKDFNSHREVAVRVYLCDSSNLAALNSVNLTLDDGSEEGKNSVADFFAKVKKIFSNNSEGER